MVIKKYNIILQPVEENDAEFIISLRTDPKKSRFISVTQNDVDKQKDWIRAYKIKEENEAEFYFIATDENNVKFATYRLYNIEDDICEIGSWVSKPDYDNAINSIKVDIIMKEFVFDNLGYDQLRFEVNKNNFSVVKYHKLFSPKLVGEDDKNYYFVLDKQSFKAKRSQVFKNIK